MHGRYLQASGSYALLAIHLKCHWRTQPLAASSLPFAPGLTNNGGPQASSPLMHGRCA
jgi:hypothetical protein